MIDVDKWGAPPPITDNTGHGELLKALNELGFDIQKNDVLYTTVPMTTLNEVNSRVTAFEGYVKTLIEKHTSKVGVHHQETKKTIGLNNKDNFPMATTDECANFLNVDAYVSPAGAKAAIDRLSSELTDRYQQNDIYPISVISNPPLLKHAKMNTQRLSTLSQGAGMVGRFKDSLLLSLKQSGNSNNTFSVYKGFNASSGVNNRFYDTGGIQYGLKGNEENPTVYEEIGNSAAGRVLVIENPDKTHTGPLKISIVGTDLIADSINAIVSGFSNDNASAHRNIFADTSRGTVGGVGPDTHAYIWQSGWGINADSTSPIPLTIERTYSGLGSSLFTDMFRNGNWIGINIASICKSNDPNVELRFLKCITSTCWEVRDRSYVLKLQGIISHKNTSTGKIIYFNFVCAFRGTITHTTPTIKNIDYAPVYYFSPTVLVESDLTTFNSGYTRLFEKGSCLDTMAHTGSMIEGGLYVRLKTHLQHSYVHYTRFNEITTVLDYFKTPVNELDGDWANTIPLAHIGLSPFGNTPQRLIPIEYSSDGFKILSFALNNAIGGWSWSQLAWSDKTLTSPRTSFKTPDRAESIPSGIVPPSTTTVTSSIGTSLNVLNFVSANDYTGWVNAKFISGAFTYDREVKLSPVYLVGLLKEETAFLAKAIAYYGTNDAKKHQEFSVGVFTLNDGSPAKNNAVIVMSDGLQYFEIAIANYVVVNDTYEVTTPVSALKRKRFVPSTPLTNFNGSLLKDDTYTIATAFSDMGVYEHPSGEISLTFNRPWGEGRIGKVAVHLTTYDSNTLEINGQLINSQPAKLVGDTSLTGTPINDAEWDTPYQNTYVPFPVVNSATFESVDICIPGFGLICNASSERTTNKRAVKHFSVLANGNSGVEYFVDTIQDGDVVVPSGYPLVLSGRAMSTQRDVGFNAKNSAAGWNYYLKRTGFNLNIEGVFERELEPRSDHIEIANYDEVQGGVILTENEITINGLKMSYRRKGSSFPMSTFLDPNGKELYKFFYYDDAPHYIPHFRVDLPETKTLYATEGGQFTVDIYSRVPPVTASWYIRWPNNSVTKIKNRIATVPIGNFVNRCTIDQSFIHWNLSGSKIWCEGYDVRSLMTKSSECEVIVTQPIFRFTVNNVASKTIAWGGEATYSVDVESQAGVSGYRWLQKVGGVTKVIGLNQTASITSQKKAQNGSTVWCEVTDKAGQVLTSVVCVNTVELPVLVYTTNLPATITVDYAGTATYVVDVNSQAGIAEYRWFQNVGGNIETFAVVPGNNPSSTVVRNDQRTSKNGSTVWCKVTDIEGNVITSVTSRLTVNAPIFQFTTNNVATKAVTNGDPATYSVVVQSDAGVKQYVWYQKLSNGNVSEVGNTASITLNNQGTAQSGSEVYCVVIDNENNQITSVRCVQTVSAPILEFTSNIPASVNLVYAGIYAFSVAVNAQAGVQSYEWYQRKADGTVVLESRTAKNYIPRQTTRDDKSTRWCVVTDNVGQKITSTICTINVAAPIFSFTTNLPATKAVDSNSSAVFSVGVNSQAGIQSYQWWRVMGGVPAVVGTNSNSLTLNNQVTANDGSQIYCVVTDIEGNQITSVVCTLEVRLPTLEFRTNNVATKKIMEGGTTNLSVVVNSQVGVSRYQWYLRKGGTTTSVGDNDRVLTILSAPYSWNGGELFVVVTDNTGQQITSNACVLTVIKAILEFTAQPANTTVAWDGTANFSTTVNSNIGSLVYVWKLNGAVVGGNSKTLSLPNRRANGTVVVEVTDGFGNKITSNAATITVNPAALSFTSNIPTTKTLGYYEDASFTVAVNAQAGVASYTWYRKQGANTSVVGSQATLTLIDQNASNTGNTVWCEVTDNEGSKITSVVCTLTVAMPYITTDLVTPIYHHVSPNAKTFSIVIQPYAGVPEFTWWIIPYGTSTPIQIANGITSDGTSSTLQYVMDNVQDMVERVFCKVTFPADATATLQSTTSVIYLSTPLEFSLNLPATRTTTRPGVEKTFNVAVIGGTGNPTYSWYTQWTNASGVEDSAKYAGGSPSLTFMLQGGAGSSYKVWVRVQDPIMGDVITSNQQVIALANPITLTHQMPSEMWGDKDGTTEVFVSVLDTNGPYTFTWTSDEPGLEINSVDGRHASMVRFKKAEGFVRFNLNLKVTDKDGGTSVFSSVINTYTVYRTSGEFDPMPPKINIIGPNSSDPALVTAVTGGGVATPLIFDYFRSDGTSQSYEAEQKFHVRPYVNSGVPGTANEYIVEVYDTGSQGGVLSSHLFVTLDVDSPANGWGLGPVAPGTDHDYAVLIPQNIGRPPMATFLYYTDVTVPFYQRKTIQFGYKVSMIPGQLVAASQLPPEVRTKTLEIYGGAIDADGRWWVTPVTTVLPSRSSVGWQDNFLGHKGEAATTWRFTFKPSGEWKWTGNSPNWPDSGQWLPQLPGNGADYSIRIVSTNAGSTHSGTNITTSWQPINVDRYVTVSARSAAGGSVEYTEQWGAVLEIKNNTTGQILSSGGISLEAMSFK